MTGERDLNLLLNNLQPVLTPGMYVFCSSTSEAWDHAQATPLATMYEPEGLALVLRSEDAERLKMNFKGRFRCIRLDVHSSLEAVGLTAYVSSLLAKHGISANVIAGTYHAHVLVPADHADDALQLLINRPR